MRQKKGLLMDIDSITEVESSGLEEPLKPRSRVKRKQAQGEIIDSQEMTDPPVTVEEAPVEQLMKTTGKIFLGEEDKRLLRKLNSHLVKKLGLKPTRSHRIR